MRVLHAGLLARSSPAARTPPWAWALCVVAVLGLVAATLLARATGVPPEEHSLILFAGTSAVVGAVVASRQPRNPIGWWFLASGVLLAATGASEQYARYAASTADGLPGSAATAWLSSWLWVPGVVLVLVVVPLHFPDGRLVSPAWRVVRTFAVAFCVLLTGLSATEAGEIGATGVANPLAARPPRPVAEVLDATVTPLWLGLLATGALSLLVRYRRSGPTGRRQIRWLAGAAALVPVWFLLNAPVAERFPALFVVADAAVLSAVPIAAGLAIVRHRLYDIDLVVNRTLVYVALTAALVAVYAVVVTQVGALLPAAGQPWPSVVATGVVAVLLAPLRERLQRAVNHVMYGDRDDPYTVVSRLGRRLETALAPQDLLPAIAETVREALRLPYAAISLRDRDTEDVVASSGEPGTDLHRVPLVHQSEEVGALLLGPRPGDRGFSAADRRLLEDLARQAGVAAHAVRLTADLKQARERLVTTREEERRRLRRDLHDGLGPTLGSLTLTVDVARDLLERDPSRAAELLTGAKEKAQAAVTDVRRLVYALRPPALDDLGLVGALREAAASCTLTGLVVSVDAPDDLPDLPAAVEVAAFRIAQEALTNVQRHAETRAACVRLALEDSTLRVEVEDDGKGVLGGQRAGVGITAMRERAEELGGRCLVGPTASGGTLVRAELPVGSHA